ncbi:putative peroxisomal membrane protein PMP27 [Limtongia smithiae]|uniref:putative peroxisomal membrane protein PMP27 n=1 Tax=Limtongia smithiae TaxID=1125753 RepID=UPI0034CE7277
MSAVTAFAQHPTLSHLLRFLDTTVARDKLLRMLQYYARFYSAYLLRHGDSAKTAATWKALMTLVSTARKLMRVGKPLQHLKAAAAAADNKASDAFVRYTAVARQLAYAGYLTADSLILAHSTKLLTLSNPQLVQKLYNQFWLSGITFSLASGLYKHAALYKRESVLAAAAEKDAVAIKKIRAERAANNTQITLDVLDSSIPISGLALLPLDDSVVGVAGMVSSFIGASAQWQTTA